MPRRPRRGKGGRPTGRCRILLPLVLLLCVCACLIALGATLLFVERGDSDDSSWPALLAAFFDLHGRLAAYVGLSLVILGVVLGPAAIGLHVFCTSPSTRARLRQGMLADALLEELVGGESTTALSEHYDVFSRPPRFEGGHLALPMSGDALLEAREEGTDEEGEEEEEEGRSSVPGTPGGSSIGHTAAVTMRGPPMTLILLAGESSPRAASLLLAQHLASTPGGAGIRAITVDLPGHGSLAAVAFSLARAERVLQAVIEAELAPQSGRSVAAAEGAGDSALYSSRARASRVVLVAYSASAFVAAHYAACNPQHLAGVVIVGTVPRYDAFSIQNGLLKALYRLPWVYSLSSLGILGKLQAKAAAAAAATLANAGAAFAATKGRRDGRGGTRPSAASDFSEEGVEDLADRAESGGSGGAGLSEPLLIDNDSDRRPSLPLPGLGLSSSPGWLRMRRADADADGGLVPYRVRRREARLLPSDASPSFAGALLEDGHEWYFRVRPAFIRECQYAQGYADGRAGGYVEGPGEERRGAGGRSRGSSAPPSVSSSAPSTPVSPGSRRTLVARGKAPRTGLWAALAALPRPILVLGPESAVKRARGLLPVPQARFAVAKGVRDEILPSLGPRKTDAIAAMLAEFAIVCFEDSAKSLRAAAEAARARAQAASRAASSPPGRGTSSGGGGGRGSLLSVLSDRLSGAQNVRSRDSRSSSPGSVVRKESLGALAMRLSVSTPPPVHEGAFQEGEE